MRAPDLARLCEDPGFGAEAAAAYGAKFAEHGLDGWVAAEVDDWEDYAEAGCRGPRDRAVLRRARGGRAAAGAGGAGGRAGARRRARGARRRRPRGRRDGRGRRLRPLVVLAKESCGG